MESLNSTLWVGLTWTSAVVRFCIPNKAWSTELALRPRGVVDAAEAVASVWVTELSGALRVCIPTAVTWHTNTRRFVEAGVAPVTPRAAVLGKALVTHRRATGVCTEKTYTLEPHYC